ncbi:MAG: TIGR04282 family arsenosugar biosynthesis glycosyltransferase [Acidobacteria bacterium]|nr:TIGR04282 family arsenosugar biosynthesis glycosyltransferase [Acidobacteriota bacterium]
MPRPAVIVMAKAPRPGGAKTRLVPPLTPAGAAELAACFFADAVSLALGAAERTVVAYAPAGGRAALEEALRAEAPEVVAGDGRLLWLEQRGEDLGERLAGVFERAAGLGLGPLVALGADSPTLPPPNLSAALEALADGRADIALGPTDDGGYYAVALRAPARGLFDAVEWSTPRAYAQTARNAARLGLRLLELPRWYDVDTPADLLRLRAEFADEAARRRAPATYRWALAHAPR